MSEIQPKTTYLGYLSRIRPAVNIANQHVSLPGQHWGPRKNPDCQLLYIIAGRGYFTMGSKERGMGPGDCFFYGSNSPHLIVSSEEDPVDMVSIHFSWDKESSASVSPVLEIVPCSYRELSLSPQEYAIDIEGYGRLVIPHYYKLPNLESLFTQIVREYRYTEKGYETVMRGLLTQLLVTMIRHQINGFLSPEDRRKIAPALEAISKQPNINWTTLELADLCGYHPTYFAEIFKNTTGNSPKHYLILERIRKAKQYLLEAGTVEGVADQLGYTSVHYFCRNFKDVTGLTPTEYKKRSIEL